jgi:hypothetical protein
MGILTTSTTTAGTISTQDGCCSGVDLRGNGEWEANICTFSETLRFMRSDRGNRRVRFTPREHYRQGSITRGT